MVLFELLIGGTIAMTTFSCFVTLPIYVAVLFLIVANRRRSPFNSDFFTLFVAFGLVDIVGAIAGGSRRRSQFAFVFSCYLLFLCKPFASFSASKIGL